MLKKVFQAFILVFAVSGLFAQEGTGVPHVSQIRAEARNNFIRLTWVDSPDATGPVYIFRSMRPFSGTIPANSRPVVVKYGEQYYIDDTEEIENIYYFIAASDTSGRRYDIIIPKINSTNVNIAQAPEAEEPPVIEIHEPVLGISNLRVTRDGDRLIITYDTTGPRKNAILYRSMQPVRRPQDLLNAVVVQSGIDSPFVDFPVPGISWYYAVIYEDEISGGNMGIKPGINATVSAASITGDEAVERAIRPIPLPDMSLRNAMSDSFFMTDIFDKVPLSSDTERMLNNTQMPSKAPLTLKKPRVFTVDMQSPAGGEESALFQIIKEYFEKRDWEGARAGLQHYLTLPRSKDVEARARFYLGQTLYFTGNYKEALFEFLSIKSLYPAESNIWIDAILTAMVY